MNEDHMSLTDDEFGMMLHMISDNDTVPVGHLKDIVAWIREEGKKGMIMDSRDLILFSSALLSWMVSESGKTAWGIIN